MVVDSVACMLCSWWCQDPGGRCIHPASDWGVLY